MIAPAKFLAFLFALAVSGISAQQEVKVYKIDQLVNRIRNADTVYVLNFWATWCKPCVAELPAFEKLNADSSGKKIKVLLVSMDFKEDIKTKLQPFLKKNGMRSEVILLDETDATYFIPQLDDRWSGAIPATLIKRGDKKVFAQKKLDQEQLLQLLKEACR